MPGKKQPDVIVIGGGLIGCSIALRLAQAGLRVTVIERGEPGKEASSAAAGMLSPQGETIEPREFFELCMASRKIYPSFVREVEELSGLKADYRRCGTLMVATNRREHKELETIFRAQKKMGLAISRLYSKTIHSKVRELSPSISFGVFLPDDHSIDNEKLSAAVATACKNSGVEFHTGCSVMRIIATRGQVEGVEIASESGAAEKLDADQLVLAAGCWSAALAEPIGIKLLMKPCRGQMVEFEAPRPLPLVVRAGHHYLVPRSNSRIVVGTTSEYAGFEKSVTASGLQSVMAGAVKLIPDFGGFKFLRAWSGLRPDTADHLPILGRGEISNLIFATGHYRNGILLAPITAEIISDLVVKASTPRPIRPYDPLRFQ